MKLKHGSQSSTVSLPNFSLVLLPSLNRTRVTVGSHPCPDEIMSFSTGHIQKCAPFRLFLTSELGKKEVFVLSNMLKASEDSLLFQTNYRKCNFKAFLSANIQWLFKKQLTAVLEWLMPN